MPRPSFRTRGRGNGRIVYPVYDRKTRSCTIFRASSNPWDERRGSLQQIVVPDTSSKTNFERAMEQHEQRSPRAKKLDEILEARITNDYAKWSKAPNRWDIEGIDNFPAPLKQGDFLSNVKVLGYTTEGFYGKDFSDLKIFAHTSYEDYDKSYGEKDASSQAYAFARREDKEVHFSPIATKAITEGKITNTNQLFAISSVVHEIGHIAGKPDAGRAFDEGSNEILATKYTIDHIQMDRDLRKEIRFFGLQHSYKTETRIAGILALIMADGDKHKAIEWLKNFRTVEPSKYHLARLNRITQRREHVIKWKDKAMGIPFKEPTGIDTKLDKEKINGKHPYDIADEVIAKLDSEYISMASIVPKRKMRLDLYNRLVGIGMSSSDAWEIIDYPASNYNQEGGSIDRSTKNYLSLKTKFDARYPKLGEELSHTPQWWLKA